MTRRSVARAFTLIELVVVIVIIGILIAIPAVTYTSVIDHGKKSALNAAAQAAKVIQATSAGTRAPMNTVTTVTPGFDAAEIELGPTYLLATDTGYATDRNGDGDTTDPGENNLEIITVEKDGHAARLLLTGVPTGGAYPVIKAP